MTSRTPELLDRVAELAALGVCDPDIAAAIGITPRSVLRWRTNAGIPSTWTPPPPPHGRPGRYARGCHCRTCQRAHAARQALWRAAQQSRSRRAPRWGMPWTPDEDAQLLALGVTAGPTLGRTFSACANRLTHLRRQP